MWIIFWLKGKFLSSLYSMITYFVCTFAWANWASLRNIGLKQECLDNPPAADFFCQASAACIPLVSQAGLGHLPLAGRVAVLGGRIGPINSDVNVGINIIMNHAFCPCYQVLTRVIHDILIGGNPCTMFPKASQTSQRFFFNWCKNVRNKTCNVRKWKVENL
jgi:hypothetical protein